MSSSNLVENLRKTIVRIATRTGMYQKRTERYVHYLHSVLNIHEGAYILDVGGSDGDILRKLIENLGQDNHGVVIDIDLEAMKQGKKRGGAMEFVCADAENIPFKSKSFELLVGVTVLEYLRNPSNCIKELSRVIKEKGYAFVVLPNLQWFIEPYTKWPLLSFFPRVIQEKIMARTPAYTHVNLDVNMKDIVTSFINEGFVQICRLPVYHSDFLKILIWPPSWRIYFRK